MTLPYYELPNHLPALTEKEREFFRKYDIEFFEKYNIRRVIPLWRRMGMTLQRLAVDKLFGSHGFKQDTVEAVNHHQKACQYSPSQAHFNPTFRKRVGLPIVSL